jgi:hypothetical protein
MLTCPTKIDNLRLLQPNRTIRTWHKKTMTMLAKLPLDKRRNLHLKLHSNLTSKINIPIRTLRIRTKTRTCLLKQNLNPIQSNPLLLQRFSLMQSFHDTNTFFNLYKTFHQITLNIREK